MPCGDAGIITVDKQSRKNKKVFQHNLQNKKRKKKKGTFPFKPGVVCVLSYFLREGTTTFTVRSVQRKNNKDIF